MKTMETKSFTDILNKENKNIVIPIIQRDYVQGLNTEPINEKRKNFLEYLCDGYEQKTLDFIYGYTEGDKFIPIDGQQRLTTLFLMAVYDTINNHNFNNNHNSKIDLSKFTYELRPSTKEFLESLIEQKHIEELKELLSNEKLKPSEVIKDQMWFVRLWEKDPSISAMLNTLDDIHEICEGKKDLWSNVLEQIKFNFWDLNSDQSTFDQAEDIFIKMNARGLLLTSFQQFKAWLLDNITFKGENDSEKEDKKYNFEVKLDVQWFDFFWELTKEKENPDAKTEKIMLKFFYIYFMKLFLDFYINNGHKVFAETKNETEKEYIEEEKKKLKEILDLKESIKEDYEFRDEILNKLKDTNYFHRSLLEWILEKSGNKVDGEKIESIFNRLEQTAKILENIKFKFVYKKEDDDSKNDSETDFIKILKEENSNREDFNREITILLAIMLFNEEKEDSNNLFKFIRVVRNLVYNSAGNISVRYSEISKLFNDFKNSGGNDFYKFIAENEDLVKDIYKKDKDIVEQADEEIRKAKLISENKNWEAALLEAENQWYLAGQVGFLLKMSSKNYSEKSWGEFVENITNFETIKINEFNINDFKIYFNVFKAVFNAEYKADNDPNIPTAEKYLLRRALLSYGDYLPFIGSNKYTFCCFEHQYWKYVFKGKSCWGNNCNNIFLYNLLKSIIEDKGRFTKILLQAEVVLNEIIQKRNKEIKIDKDNLWRKIFIENPQFINKSGEQTGFRIYFIGPKNIYLKERGTSGSRWHANSLRNLFLLDLNKKLEQSKMEFKLDYHNKVEYNEFLHRQHLFNNDYFAKFFGDNFKVAFNIFWNFKEEDKKLEYLFLFYCLEGDKENCKNKLKEKLNNLELKFKKVDENYKVYFSETENLKSETGFIKHVNYKNAAQELEEIMLHLKNPK